ncbi:MAG: hypothetical protein QOH05_4671, partial [Acetobacteraceae bacterium]|nr:hypothetical protein [Acetobacteraceae bacterium]
MRSKFTLLFFVVYSACSLLSGTNPSAKAQGSASEPAWPHAMTVNGASVVVYQPQAIDWRDHERLTTREAIAITLPGEKAPVLGTTEISFSTLTDAATENVVLSDPKLLASHFPALDTAQAARIEQQIKEALPAVHARPVALQTVILSLKQHSEPHNADLNNDPPVILYSAKPASLVVLDGDPVLAPVGKAGLSFAVNTNWNLFTDGKDWYLLDNGLWMTAPAYTGPYRPVFKLPQAFATIPADGDF